MGHPLKKRFNKLFPFFRNFLIYSSGSFLLQGMAILLTPLWLACLSPAEYGTLELLTTLQNLVTLLIGFNISPLLSTTYYKLEEQERSHFIRQVSATALYATLISMPLLIGSAPFIQHFFFRHTVSISLILITIATGIAWIFIQMIYRVFALERKATQLTALQLTYGITMLAGSCLFVIGFKWRLTGALLIRLIAATLLCMVAIAVRSDRTLLPTRTSLARAAHYFKEGATFYPLFIAEWFFLSGNQWIIARYGSLYDVGIYALALKVGLLFQVVVTTPLNNAYAPYLYQQYEGENTILQTEKSNRKTMLSSLALLLVVSITGYYITRPFVHFFLPKAYHPALGYILGILIGQILYVGTTFATYLLRYQKRTLTCAWITLLSAGTTASLSIILIPSYGITGGILAAITGNALLFLLALYYNARAQKNCVMNPPPNSAHNIPTTPLLKGAIMKPEQLVYHIESIGIYLESGPYNKWRTTTVSTLAEALGKQVPKNAPITYKVILHDAAYMPTPERMTTIPGTASYTDLHIALPRSSFFRQQTSDYQIDIWTDGEHFNIAHILQDIFPAMHKTFVHGAGLIINGEGVLMPAYSGIGKTILMAQMAKQPHTQLLGDDLIVLSKEGHVAPYPRPFCVYNYHRSLFPDYFKKHRLPLLPTWYISHKIARRLCIMAGIEHILDRYVSRYPCTMIHPEELVPGITIARNPAPLRHIILLERSVGSTQSEISTVTESEALSFMFNILVQEFYRELPMTLVRHTGAHTSITQVFQETEAILRSALITKHPTLHRLKIPAEWSPERVCTEIPQLIIRLVQETPPMPAPTQQPLEHLQ